MSNERITVDFELARGNQLESDAGYAARVAFERGWPNALEFLRWLISDQSDLRISGRRRAWTWSKSLFRTASQ